MRKNFFSDGCLVIPAIKFKVSSGYSLNISSNFCLWFLYNLLQSILNTNIISKQQSMTTVKHSKIFNVISSSTLGGGLVILVKMWLTLKWLHSVVFQCFLSFTRPPHFKMWETPLKSSIRQPH